MRATQIDVSRFREDCDFEGVLYHVCHFCTCGLHVQSCILPDLAGYSVERIDKRNEPEQRPRRLLRPDFQKEPALSSTLICMYK